jgi:hypothetical protein
MKKFLTPAQVLLVVLLVFLVRYIVVNEPCYHQNHFVYYVSESDQPNCVVGAFCMYAKETLNVKVSPIFLETNSLMRINSSGNVDASEIMPSWNRIFPKNKIKCVYNLYDTNSYNNVLLFDRPYIWVGKLTEYHACLVYLNSNSVTYKHFVYNPYTKTNYMVMTNYPEFFSKTISLYTLQ